jgi:hypothetical protein
VYIIGGKVFDYNHKELVNKTLLFTLEKVLLTSVQMQGLFLGTLSTITEPTKILKYRTTLYTNDNYLPMSVRFLIYDVIFPYFKVDNNFKVRNDIARKAVGCHQGCTGLELFEVKNIDEFKEAIKSKFRTDRHESFLVFDKEGKYYPGNSQLTYGIHEQVSFELSASQKYRSHVKKILPVDIKNDMGNVVTIAGSIEARFKNKDITVPIIMPNYILRKNMWDHRKELKRTPFVFEGIYFEGEDNDFEILGMHYSKFIL